MNIILLSGGSGKRLWPLSNEVRSKQFLKILKRADGANESMVQRMYRMICEVDPSVKILFTTFENQVPFIYSQIGTGVDISIEPSRKDTFPAIALATAYLRDLKGLDIEEPVVVCPIDSLVERDYYLTLMQMEKQVTKNEARLVLMGIEPTYPSEKYGYIIPATDDRISSVSSFVEKPAPAVAEQYILQGVLWNGGVFGYKLKYVLEQAEQLLGFSTYKSIYEHYSDFSAISFDYAVAEIEQSVQVMRFCGQWKDMGTWNTLTEAMSDNVIGNVIAVDCYNTHAINELKQPLVALGTKNLAIIATPDGVLVSEKASSEKVKEYVLVHRPMCEKHMWGEYQILDYRMNPHSLTKYIMIHREQSIPYQRHLYRMQIWIIIEGKGDLVLDGRIRKIKRGDTVTIMHGIKYAARAREDLRIIEVQIGSSVDEGDIERFEWNWKS